MRTIKFVGGGCGFIQICDQILDEKKEEYITKREEIQKELDKKYPHNSLPHEGKYPKDNYLSDPLVLPLIKGLNNLNITTIASCQGRLGDCPYVIFRGSVEDVKLVNFLILRFHRNINEGWFWNNGIISYLRPTNSSGYCEWVLQFYDTITLMRFTQIIFNHNFDEKIPTFRW